MIQIENLTPHQVKLLDIMWSINSEDDLMDWKATLSNSDQLMVESLIQMIVLAYIDESIKLDFDCDLANQLISNFRL
jgi:hypothetical protein